MRPVAVFSLVKIHATSHAAGVDRIVTAIEERWHLAVENTERSGDEGAHLIAVQTAEIAL